MSKRTLARKLSDEGLNYSEILEHLRRDLAVRYLNDRKLHVSKIAWLLGFSEVSAFTHACALDRKDAEADACNRRIFRFCAGWLGRVMQAIAAAGLGPPIKSLGLRDFGRIDAISRDPLVRRDVVEIAHVRVAVMMLTARPATTSRADRSPKSWSRAAPSDGSACRGR
jgi:hypothetical protein